MSLVGGTPEYFSPQQLQISDELDALSARYAAAASRRMGALDAARRARLEALGVVCPSDDGGDDAAAAHAALIERLALTPATSDLYQVRTITL